MRFKPVRPNQATGAEALHDQPADQGDRRSVSALRHLLQLRFAIPHLELRALSRPRGLTASARCHVLDCALGNGLR